MGMARPRQRFVFAAVRAWLKMVAGSYGTNCWLGRFAACPTRWIFLSCPILELLRQGMVDWQLVRRGIADQRVLDAMRKVLREAFVPSNIARYAYDDCALPIEAGQTISQPYIVALMAEAACLNAEDRVLEVGTGRAMRPRCTACWPREFIPSSGMLCWLQWRNGGSRRSAMTISKSVPATARLAGRRLRLSRPFLLPPAEPRSLSPGNSN